MFYAKMVGFSQSNAKSSKFFLKVILLYAVQLLTASSVPLPIYDKLASMSDFDSVFIAAEPLRDPTFPKADFVFNRKP